MSIPSFRGEFCRTEFEKLGEVIPSHVHVIALTGTATKRTIIKASIILA